MITESTKLYNLKENIIAKTLCKNYIDTYHSCFYPEGLAEAYFSETLTLYQNDLAMRNTVTADVTGMPIPSDCSLISGGSGVNPLVAFHDIHGRKAEVLFFCSVPDTTQYKTKYLRRN
jgi:hypothetical protein